MNHMHPEEIAERKIAWQRIWRERFVDEITLFPPKHQGHIHELMRQAFNAGTTWERRKHLPIQTGGND